MARLGKQYAKALMELAQEHGNLEEIYRQALRVSEDKELIMDEEMPKELKVFLQLIEEKDLLPTLQHFVEMVREELRIAHADVISAVPLTDKQLAELERKLIHLTRKRVEIVNHVDASLLGGVRIILDDTVIDNSIKSQLSGMKEQMYEGVYFKQ